MSDRIQRWSSLALGLFLVLAGASATAQPPPPEEGGNAAPDEETVGPWGEPRWFVSGRLDVGYLFLRPSFYGGYGTPHESWVGLEASPLISGRGVGIYGGVRGELPFGELRAGARYFFTFTRSFLSPSDSFDHLQIWDRTGPSSRFLSLEAQLEFAIPIGPIEIVSETTATYIALVDPDFFVYEEFLRVVVDPPFIWGSLLGIRISFGDRDEFHIEPRVELVHLVDREDFVIRVGLAAAIDLWPDLQIRLIALPAIVSPDPIGAAGGDTFLLGLRYRWATDRPDPNANAATTEEE